MVSLASLSNNLLGEKNNSSLGLAGKSASLSSLSAATLSIKSATTITADTVSISGKSGQNGSSGNILVSGGTYSISTSLSISLTAASISTASTTGQTANSQANGNSATAGVSAPLMTSLKSIFGANSSAMDNLNQTIGNLSNIDSKLLSGILALMALLGKDHPDAAKSMLASLSSLGSLMSQASASLPTGQGQLSANTNAVSVANFEATLSANFTTQIVQSNSGFAASVSASLSLDASLTVASTEATLCDPLVLDLGGDGIDLTSIGAGASFDINGDGTQDQTAFVQGDDALLYLDGNSNGVADSGLELFGDQEGDANGFAELSRHDGNSDGAIDANDSIYSQLRLWQDLNGDGINQAEESLTLLEAGVKAIKLACAQSNQDDGKGNTLAQFGSFLRDDGTTGEAVDALLACELG